MRHVLLICVLLLYSCASTPSPPSSGIYTDEVGLPPPTVPTEERMTIIPYSTVTVVNPQEVDQSAFSQGQELVSDTKTRTGRDFFRQFYLQWQVDKPKWEHPITIAEKPAMGSGFAVIITVITQNHTVWGKVVRPNSRMIHEAAQEAALAMQQMAQQNNTK